jgi:hypothetical protein
MRQHGKAAFNRASNGVYWPERRELSSELAGAAKMINANNEIPIT